MDVAEAEAMMKRLLRLRCAAGTAADVLFEAVEQRDAAVHALEAAKSEYTRNVAKLAASMALVAEAEARVEAAEAAEAQVRNAAYAASMKAAVEGAKGAKEAYAALAATAESEEEVEHFRQQEAAEASLLAGFDGLPSTIA